MPRGFGGRWGGGGWGRGWGGGFRRGGWGWGGYGMGGWGMGGSPLMTGLMAGGLGYLLGSNSGNQPPTQPVPMAYPPYPGYPPPSGPAPSADNSVMTQLQMLSNMHNAGTLTDEEFARAKQRLLGQ